MFVRIYHRPRLKGQGIGTLSPKNRYRMDRSVERYRKDPAQAKLMDDVIEAFREGEIGKIERVRFIISKRR